LRRKEAQEKLADYIESAAIYLGTPGNTVAGWIEKKRNQGESVESGNEGRSLQDFMAKAKAANPDATEQDIIEYYNSKYGGQ
jgi:hypothetical protein